MLVGRGGFYREGDLQLLLEFYFLLLPAAFTPRLSLNCVEDLFEIIALFIHTVNVRRKN